MGRWGITKDHWIPRENLINIKAMEILELQHVLKLPGDWQ